MSVAARKLDRDALRPPTVGADVVAAVHRAANDDTYYKLGNLNTRTNGLNSVTETLSYDTLNRLADITSTATGVPAKHYGFDAIGNITSKTGVGSYTYGGPRPHAVTSISPSGATSGDADGDGTLTTADTAAILNNILKGTALTGNGDCNSNGQTNVLDYLCVNARIVSTTLTYNYDANGNMASGAGRAISYTAFNMPSTVDYNGVRETYTYGPDYARISKQVMTVSSGTVSQTTTYLGKLYEHIDRSGTVEERFYISAGDRLVAEVSKSGSTTNTYYVHSDLLGSAETVTDSTKAVVDNVSFDAWGLPRQANWQDGAPVSAFNKTTRGYTGHETDIASGLVNMNARLYDPVTGRFLQADTVIPDVFNPQAFNPYSYVLNNPFGYTDPTGHDWAGTNNGTAAFNDGTGSGGVTATYNFGSGQYVFSDGSVIDADGTYHEPSNYGQLLYVSTTANWANGVGPDYASPTAVASGATRGGNNFGGSVTYSNTSPSYGTNSSRYSNNGYGSGNQTMNSNGLGGVGAASANGTTHKSRSNGVSDLEYIGTPWDDIPLIGGVDKLLALGISKILGTDALKLGTREAANALTTSPGEAVFWSGLQNGGASAAEWAAKNGGVTLEAVSASRGIALPAWNSSDPAVVAAWRQASYEFAAGASGDVHVLQTNFVRTNSVWVEVEFPALKANPAVNSITAVNPETGAESLLWAR